MRPGPRQSGFTLLEVMIAVLLLSAISLGLTRTLVTTQRARALSEQWMQATQLAVEGMEQLRAGQPIGPVRITGTFARTAVVQPWDGHPGLNRLEVTVSWNDGEPRDFHLITLARQ